MFPRRDLVSIYEFLIYSAQAADLLQQSVHVWLFYPIDLPLHIPGGPHCLFTAQLHTHVERIQTYIHMYTLWLANEC